MRKKRQATANLFQSESRQSSNYRLQPDVRHAQSRETGIASVKANGTSQTGKTIRNYDAGRRLLASGALPLPPQRYNARP